MINHVIFDRILSYNNYLQVERVKERNIILAYPVCECIGKIKPYGFVMKQRNGDHIID